ncbi:MAG: hypothetical protein AAFQ47_18105 [Pseudomonadota bacterium]
MKFALISALVIAAAPAFADVTSPAERAAQHDFVTTVQTSSDLGKTSAAEIKGQAGSGSDVISTQNYSDLVNLGVTSPAERAAR